MEHSYTYIHKNWTEYFISVEIDSYLTGREIPAF
jgi:hypothetical protein